MTLTAPNIIVIGAPRSGTTSLYNYLKQHPQVYMSPVKETRFFAYEGQTVRFTGPADARTINQNTITRLEDYVSLFGQRTDEPVAGEASPIYLYEEQAADRIRHYVPDAKLIAILRNPVERAYSDFLNMVRLGWEPLHDFEQAIEAEAERIRRGWGPFYHYQAKGFYAEQIKRYLDRFDREQLRIYLYEDLRRDAERLMRDVFQFVGVDENEVQGTTVRHNRSGLPHSRLLHKALTHPATEAVLRGPLRPIRESLRDWNTAYEKPALSVAMRERLTEHFRDDIKRLQDVIDRDLSRWMA